MLKYGPITFLAAWLLAFGPACARREKPDTPIASPPKPNIIFVMIDTLRADRLGCYGYARPLTQFMDQLAADGVRFSEVIAQAPWTQPSIASIHSSTYPSVHGVLDYKYAMLSSFKKQPMSVVFDESFTTLAECLQAAGYHTVCITANPFTLRDYGFAQGFDHYDDSTTSTTVPGYVLNKAAVAYIKANPTDKPLFLYLHYMDVHGPFNAPERFVLPLLDEVEQMENKAALTEEGYNRLNYLRTLPRNYKTKRERHNQLKQYVEYWVARYDSGVWYADAVLAGLSKQLEELGLWEEALVVVTADHGEELYDHGGWEHGFNVFQHQLHIPLILRWPGHLAAGKTIDTMVQSVDVMPTLLDLVGVDIPDGLQGRSVRPLLDSPPETSPQIAFAEGVKFGNEQRAVLVDNFKLIRTPATGKIRVYDLAADPEEKASLPTDHARYADLLARLDKWLAGNQTIAASPRAVPISEEQQQRLKALGYSK